MSEKDNSMKVAYIIMAIFGFVGLTTGGVANALIFASLGYALTVLVYALQNSF